MDVEIPVPSLEEQKRIVAILDAATEHVTELTACYGEARTHANNLFASALRSSIAGNQKWISGALDDLCEVEYGTRVTRKRDGGTKYPVYGGGGATFYLDDFNRQDQMIVSRFAMSEECVRFVSGKFFLNDSGLTVLTRDESKMSQDFLDQQLLARSDEIYATARGTAQKNMDMTMFRSMELAYPDSLDEQKNIVARLGSMRAKTSEMVAAYDAKLTAVKNLRQSILEAAFAGEL
jgi:type I restriction enzyme S subunit